MKEYKFTTPSGNNVVINTTKNDNCYFAMYLTCEQIGVVKQFFSTCQIKNNLLKFWCRDLGRTCGITIPAEILEDIKMDYEKCCNNTGKIIVAKLVNSQNKVVCELYGKAIAEPLLKGDVVYHVPTCMECALRSHAHDGKFFDFGGIEDDPEESSFECYEGHKNRFWCRHFEPKDPLDAFINQRDNVDEECEVYELTLEVVTPIS